MKHQKTSLVVAGAAIAAALTICPANAAIITGSFTTVTNDVNDDFNITTLGGLDWAYWHNSGTGVTGTPQNSKNGASLIGSVSPVGGSGLRGTSGNNTVHDFTFTDGATTTSGTQDNAKGILNSVLSENKGVEFDILLPTADTHTIYLWVAAEQLTGRLTASMTGATDYVDSSLVAGQQTPNWNSGVYQLTVTPDSAGQTINLEYFGINQTGSGSRYAVIAGAAVSAVPEPSSAALIGLGGLALFLRRRR